MSHRPSDAYGFVATRPLRVGNVLGYQTGDPVPEDVVKAHEFDKDGGAVRRDEWEHRPADEPERTLVRGEMPPHLRDKVAKDAEPSGDEPGKSTSRTKSTGTGGKS